MFLYSPNQLTYQILHQRYHNPHILKIRNASGNQSHRYSVEKLSLLCGYCDPVRMYRKGPRSASRGTVRQTDSQTQLMGGGTGSEKYHEDIEAISREQN